MVSNHIFNKLIQKGVPQVLANLHGQVEGMGGVSSLVYTKSITLCNELANYWIRGTSIWPMYQS